METTICALQISYQILLLSPKCNAFVQKSGLFVSGMYLIRQTQCVEDKSARRMSDRSVKEHFSFVVLSSRLTEI